MVKDPRIIELKLGKNTSSSPICRRVIKLRCGREHYTLRGEIMYMKRTLSFASTGRMKSRSVGL